MAVAVIDNSAARRKLYGAVLLMLGSLYEISVLDDLELDQTKYYQDEPQQ